MDISSVLTLIFLPGIFGLCTGTMLHTPLCADRIENLVTTLPHNLHIQQRTSYIFIDLCFGVDGRLCPT